MGAILVGIPVERHRRKWERAGIDRYDVLGGHAFEHRVAEVFRSFGWHVHVTPGSGDFGADLVMTRERERVCVQAKRYSGRVGRAAVAEAVSSLPHYGGTRAMVVTNSSFTPAARLTASKWNVELVDRSRLVSMLSAISARPDPVGGRLLWRQFVMGSFVLLLVAGGFLVALLWAGVAASAGGGRRSVKRGLRRL